MREIDPPLVSVVIPARNEAGSIGPCLDAVLAQDYPADRLEVIVVDGDSEDGSAGIVRDYAVRDGRVRLLSNPQRIVPAAMNLGIRAARGDIIARVDGHTRLAPDYIRAGVEALARTGADNVGGPMRSVGGGAFGDAVATAMASRFGIGAYFHFGTEEREVDTVYLGMWPRRVLERIGVFDEELIRDQDDELNYRLRKAGGRIVLNPAMRSYYQNRQSPRRLIRQFYEYGLWKIRVLQRHPRQMSWRHFVPPAFVAMLVGGAVANVLRLPVGKLIGLVVLIYSVITASVAWRATRGRGWRAFVLTAVVFAMIHVAWGTGFLVGLVRFANGWRGPAPQPPALPCRTVGAGCVEPGEIGRV